MKIKNTKPPIPTNQLGNTQLLCLLVPMIQNAVAERKRKKNG